MDPTSRTVWVLVAEGRQFGIDVHVFATEKAAVVEADRMRDVEIDHHRDGDDDYGPDEERTNAGSDNPYYCRFEDQLTLTVERKAVRK